MRLLHTMLRVGDLDKSIQFYSDIMGMELLRKHDYESGRFTLAFLGYGEEKDNTVLELTHNWIPTVTRKAKALVISRLQWTMFTLLVKKFEKRVAPLCVSLAR